MLLLNALGRVFPGAVYVYQATLVLTVASAAHYAYLATARRAPAAP